MLGTYRALEVKNHAFLTSSTDCSYPECAINTRAERLPTKKGIENDSAIVGRYLRKCVLGSYFCGKKRRMCVFVCVYMCCLFVFLALQPNVVVFFTAR
jgi:hypothetical protein